MKKSSKILGWVLFASLFVACAKEESDRIVYFYDEPVVVETLDENSFIRSPHGNFVVPSLNSADVKKGDLLWTVFQINLDSKDRYPLYNDGPAYYKTIGFKYSIVDSSQVIIPADASEFQSYLDDDYKAFIDQALLYSDYLDSLLFFGLIREKTENVLLDFEMILNPEIESRNGYPTLYIRSKKIEILTRNSSYAGQETIFAFDMADFIKKYSNKNRVGFNLKYKTGVDEDGKDVYREFISNPIIWEIKKQ
jgi:hypothetical protein